MGTSGPHRQPSRTGTRDAVLLQTERGLGGAALGKHAPCHIQDFVKPDWLEQELGSEIAQLGQGRIVYP